MKTKYTKPVITIHSFASTCILQDPSEAARPNSIIIPPADEADYKTGEIVPQ